MAEVPQRTCKQCQQAFPATREHFYRQGKTGLRAQCKGCVRQALDSYDAAGNARRQAERLARRGGQPPTSNLPSALRRAPVRPPPRLPDGPPSWRAVLQAETLPRMQELARAIVSLAADKKDPTMLRYLGEQLLGFEDAGENRLTSSLRQLGDARLAELNRQYADPGPAGDDSGDAGRGAAAADGDGPAVEPGAECAPGVDGAAGAG